MHSESEVVEHSERQQRRMDTVYHEPSLGDVVDEADGITIDHHQVYYTLSMQHCTMHMTVSQPSNLCIMVSVCM